MRFCLSWLEEWLALKLDPQPLAADLTMAGLEVNKLTPACPSLSNIVVGHIRHIEPHPNADRLQLCLVDAGGTELLQIVCAAPNIHEGMRAPLALVGARIADQTIKKTEIRGIPSHGMLCSGAELGIEEKSEGILDLGVGVAAGTDLIEYLKLNDIVFELDLTPNRADCFSVLGLAREVAAIRGENLVMPGQNTVTPTHDRRFPVQVAEPTVCPHYVTRVVHNVNVNASTPLWMKERLRKSGIRALYSVVDVMNYVMMELGQPMHAFDLDKVERHIEVRYARSDEQIEIIGGTQINLDERSLLIADAQKPLALAGIIGSSDSAVSQHTQNILIESAFFEPEVIMGKARSYGLHTESSLRFERGVDRSLQQHAVERACELLSLITGGEFGPISEMATPSKTSQAITLRYEALVRRLGVEINRNEIPKMLMRLGCRIKSCKGGWQCVTPPYRFDLEIEEDLIEEVGRLYGYEKMTASKQMITVHHQISDVEDCYERSDRWCDRLVDRGYFEVVTYSFVDSNLAVKFNEREVLSLSNAISPEMSVMRTSLWPGLLKTLVHNLNRQQNRVRIFELGRCFDRQGERLVIAGLVYGDVYPEQWGEVSRACDFYDIKGDVQDLFIGETGVFLYEPSAHCGLHVGQTANISLDGKRVGCLGALDPTIAQQLDISGNTFLFEIEIDALALTEPPQVELISRYPSVRRDMSFVVPNDVNSDQILHFIKKLCVKDLRKVVFFDVYEDKKGKIGRKNMTIGLIFQNISSTLSDESCADSVNKIIEVLTKSLKVTLRA